MKRLTFPSLLVLALAVTALHGGQARADGVYGDGISKARSAYADLKDALDTKRLKDMLKIKPAPRPHVPRYKPSTFPKIRQAPRIRVPSRARGWSGGGSSGYKRSWPDWQDPEYLRYKYGLDRKRARARASEIRRQREAQIRRALEYLRKHGRLPKARPRRSPDGRDLFQGDRFSPRLYPTHPRYRGYQGRQHWRLVAPPR